MADNPTDGIVVGITVDTSKLKTDIDQAKTAITGFSKDVQSGMSQSAASMASAGDAADKMSKSTKELGEAMGETGSRRELRESMNLLKASADGTGGAMDALRAIMVTFASSIGGPALIAVTAAIAVLGTLYELTKQYIEEQRMLGEESAQFKLPIEQIEAMTTAMKALAAQIAGAQDGFGHLDQAKFNLIKLLGLDPADADSARKAIVMVENSADDLATKMHNFAILSGETDPAKIAEGWDKAMEENKKSSKGWFDTWMGYIAAGELAQAGMYKESEEAMPKTKGNANKEGVTTGGNVGKAKTQQQIDDEQKLQDELSSLEEKGADARIATMTNEADKIIAEAQLETTRLVEEKKKQVAALHDDPEAQKKLGDQYDKTISDVQNEAKVHAAQVRNQQILDEQTKFNTEMKALTDAQTNADVNANMSASDKIIADGQAKIAALKKQLDDYLSSPEFQKLSAGDKANKKAALTSQFNTSSAATEHVNDFETRRTKYLTNRG